MSCKLPPAPFTPGSPHSSRTSRPPFSGIPCAPFPAAAGRYPELGVPFPDWVPFGSPGCPGLGPDARRVPVPEGACAWGGMRCQPALARRLRVLSKLGMNARERGRTGTFAPSLAGSSSRYLEEGGAAGVSASIEARQLRGLGALDL